MEIANEAEERKPAIRVFLDSVPWFIRPLNTDIRYVRENLPLISRFEPRVAFHTQSSPLIGIQENYRYVKGFLGAKLGLPVEASFTSTLDRNELKGSACDVVFSHRGFPRNADPWPVVWQNSILDPQMTLSYRPHHNLQREIDLKAPLFSRAAIVHVSTQAEAARLNTLLPTSPGRFFATPFFVPGARAAEKNALEKHHRQEKIQILFCGDQARRKGLDLVIEAFFKLPVTVRRRASLRVISRLSDGALSIPDDPSIKVESGLPHDAVMEAMRDAHILAVPSRFESYGLVFLEAMSRGTLVIAPNWEVQRELLDYGRAGILVDPGACKSLVDALELSIEDEEARVRLSTKGYERFNQCYSPERVAKRFLSMVQTANSGASDIPTN